MRSLLALICSLIILVPIMANAASQRVCLQSATGKIVIKRRCKSAKGFEELSAELLQGLGASQVGPQGPQGEPGPAGVTGQETVTEVEMRGFSGMELFGVQLDCPIGKVVVSYSCSADIVTVSPVNASTPVISPDGQFAVCSYRNFSPAIIPGVTLTSKIVCGPV